MAKRLTDANGDDYVLVSGNPLRAGDLVLVEAMARQFALAAEPTRLVGELQKARVTGETERLRSALLASIAHDPRTPLASIIGSTTSLLEHGDRTPPGEREQVFDMFHRIEAGDRAAKGTGLGLTICQGLIGAHGGTVEALEGSDGRGTRMRITLPLPPEPAAPSAGQEGRARSSGRPRPG
jgi:K+-sensing histidine kinase KdpD